MILQSFANIYRLIVIKTDFPPLSDFVFVPVRRNLFIINFSGFAFVASRSLNPPKISLIDNQVLPPFELIAGLSLIERDESLKTR